MEVAYKLDSRGNAVATVDKPGRRGRTCTICRNADREGIDKLLAENKYTFAEIARQFNLKQYTVASHYNAGHIQRDIASKSDKASRISMESILAHALSVRDKASLRADNAKEAYYAPIARVTIEADKFIGGSIIEANKFKLEQDKQNKLRQNNWQAEKQRSVDFLRSVIGQIVTMELVEAYCKAVDG